jgi:hypothetical protein
MPTSLLSLFELCRTGTSTRLSFPGIILKITAKVPPTQHSPIDHTQRSLQTKRTESFLGLLLIFFIPQNNISSSFLSFIGLTQQRHSSFFLGIIMTESHCCTDLEQDTQVIYKGGAPTRR